MGRMIRAAGCLLIVTTFSLLLVSAPLFAAPRIGQTAPAFKVVTTAGQSVSLDSYRGHVLILDFFATWCQPCRYSIPHLIEMNKKFGRQGLQILGMNASDQSEKLLSEFIDEQRITYQVALAGDAMLSDYAVRAVPVMYVIDKKGKVSEVYRGYNDEIGRSVERLVRKLLEEK